MSLATAPSVARITKFLNRRGLQRINRLGKSVVRRSSGNVLSVRSGGLLIQGPVESWNVLAQIRARTFEPYEVQLFKDSLEPGMTVLDIGANLGYYTLLAAKLVGRGGRVYAFEADPRTVKHLTANVRINDLSNVVVIPKIASDSKQTRELQQSRVATYSGLHSSMPEDSIVGTALVESITIDDILDGASADVVKCDVEGEEPAVLRGMQRTLQNSPSLRLLVEFNPLALRSAGDDPATFLEELDQTFDQVFVIDERKQALTPIKSLGLARLANLCCDRPRQL
jgi:FkbM family methyltransferase